jgi:hypothetical protein
MPRGGNCIVEFSHTSAPQSNICSILRSARLPATSRLLDVVAADGVKANLTRQGVYLLLVTGLAVSHFPPR